MGYKKYLGPGYEIFLGMGYENFLGMGYKKFLGIAVEIFTRFSCERFLRISADYSQNCYLAKKARWSIKNKKVYKTNKNKHRTYSCWVSPPAATILSPSVVKVKYDLATVILSNSIQSNPSFLKHSLNKNIQFKLLFCEFSSFF